MQGLTEKVMVASGAQGGTVTLSRLAAKIVLLPTIKSPIKIDGVTYTAEVDRMDVALHHVTNYVHPDGTELTREEYNKRLTSEEKEKTFTTTDPRKYKSVTAPGAAAAYVHIPFYSYPHTWLAYTIPGLPIRKPRSWCKVRSRRISLSVFHGHVRKTVCSCLPTTITAYRLRMKSYLVQTAKGIVR